MTCLPQIERRLLLGGQFELKSGMFLSRRRYVHRLGICIFCV